MVFLIFHCIFNHVEGFYIFFYLVDFCNPLFYFQDSQFCPRTQKMCLLHHKDSPLIVCTTVPKIIFYLLLLQRFLSVRGIPTLLDINLHLLRNMIITLNHLSSVCYVLLISKDCSSCSMCRRRQCLLVNSRNLPTVKGTRWYHDCLDVFE